MSALSRLARELPRLPRLIGLAARASPRWFIAWTMLLCAHALVPALVVWLGRDVADVTARVVTTGAAERSLAEIVLPLARLCAAMLVGEVLAGAIAWTRAAQAEALRDHLTALVHEKSTAIDLAFHDAHEFHDRLHRARDAGAEGPIVLLESLGSTLEHTLTLFSLGVILAPFGVLVPLAFAVSVAPAAWLVISVALAQHRWRVSATPRIRRAAYLDELITQPYAAVEVRLHDLGPFLRARYAAIRASLRDEQLALERRAAMARVAASVATLAIAGGTVLVIGRSAMLGGATIGELVVLVQAFAQGQRVTAALMSNAGTVYRQALLTAGLFDFLALENEMPLPSQPIALSVASARSLRFEHVAFRYPRATERALDGLDLEVRAGTVAAVVGVNGAGKSTLVKLVARLYDPDEGRVTLDGTDLRSLDPVALRRDLSILVQDQLRFYATARDNVQLGDAKATDPAEIDRALRASGADEIVARLPDGLDTQLGAWLGGRDLSVGEWQRLALARASLRRASVMVLDEPTSAMDSWAESAWLDRFRAISAGRTVLLVTHRFTTAMRADVIHVVDAGRVIESGTHAELLALNGRYATSWRAQVEAATSL